MTCMMITDDDRIEYFKETRDCTKYNKLLVTTVYTEEMLNNISIKKFNRECNVILRSDSNTVDEILESDNNEYIAALNFADGYTPGGLVLYGASTQEEDLCRSSNLYESLIEKQCDTKYYTYNNKFKHGKCSDRIIYTRDVTFFRNSDLEWLNDMDIRTCDIITCPAPVNGTATDEEIRQRMSNILKVAIDNRVTKLILGCWGCGAFGNKWSDFSKLWLEVIDELEPNLTIIFATYGKGMSAESLYGGDAVNEYKNQ